MAYSDYGGYAFKNGKRIEERSDAVLSPAGVKATPGMWPGFLLEEGRNGGSFHALLGDGPIYVGLYKQSSLSIHRLMERLDELTVAKELPPEAIKSYEHEGNVVHYLDTDHFKTLGTPCVFEADGCKVEVFWEIDDNHYQYVKLTQPDGNVWHGWSGYGVGAGLEDCGYGYSTEDRNKRLCELFPGAIAA